MGVLDQIIQLRSQGRSDQEIIRNLQARGVPPKEIQDALNQAQIKNAISNNPAEGMQESIMENLPEPMQDYGEEETPQELVDRLNKERETMRRKDRRKNDKN